MGRQGAQSVELGAGHDVFMRVGDQRIETLDSIRLGHVRAFARRSERACPTLEWLARHPDGDADLDTSALVEEMQALALAGPPEDLAPLLGILRNDAARVANLAAAAAPRRS